MAALIASLLLRRAPGRNQIAGLWWASWASWQSACPRCRAGHAPLWARRSSSSAIVSYGFAGNFVVPLQQRYGSLAVIWRAQIYGLVFTAPYALVGVPIRRWRGNRWLPW